MVPCCLVGGAATHRVFWPPRRPAALLAPISAQCPPFRSISLLAYRPLLFKPPSLSFFLRHPRCLFRPQLQPFRAHSATHWRGRPRRPPPAAQTPPPVGAHAGRSSPTARLDAQRDHCRRRHPSRRRPPQLRGAPVEPGPGMARGARSNGQAEDRRPSRQDHPRYAPLGMWSHVSQSHRLRRGRGAMARRLAALMCALRYRHASRLLACGVACGVV